MTQELIVAVIVALAAAYVVWRYLPSRWRRRLPAALAQEPGCGGCSACGSEGGACSTDRTGEKKATQTVALPESRR